MLGGESRVGVVVHQVGLSRSLGLRRTRGRGAGSDQGRAPLSRARSRSRSEDRFSRVWGLERSSFARRIVGEERASPQSQERRSGVGGGALRQRFLRGPRRRRFRETQGPFLERRSDSSGGHSRLHHSDCTGPGATASGPPGGGAASARPVRLGVPQGPRPGPEVYLFRVAPQELIRSRHRSRHIGVGGDSPRRCPLGHLQPAVQERLGGDGAATPSLGSSSGFRRCPRASGDRGGAGREGRATPGAPTPPFPGLHALARRNGTFARSRASSPGPGLPDAHPTWGPTLLLSRLHLAPETLSLCTPSHSAPPPVTLVHLGPLESSSVDWTPKTLEGPKILES